MSIFSRIFKRKTEETHRVGGMEDFMTLIRVYFQAAIAADLGITNLAALPDLRVFKTTLHVPTVNNKLGVGEKSYCRKMAKDMYKLDDEFFKEIDRSIHRRCRKIQDVQVYMAQFQGFSQDLMMLMGNLMKFKLRMPGFFKKALRSMTEKTVHDVFTKNDYKDPGVVKTVLTVRDYASKLGYSEKWVSSFVYTVVTLAKKEPMPKDDGGKA